jgi:phosphoribosylamine--glycine ligase
MMTADGPRLLEYNVRFGDPETQSILVRLDSDMIKISESILDGSLNDIDIKWKGGSSACVILASAGYPQNARTGDVIEGIDGAAGMDGVTIFHAATARLVTGQFVTSGGRVLGVTATGDNINGALDRAYAAVAKIHWSGMQFRRDIGK